jgi:hypothetical protein
MFLCPHLVAQKSHSHFNFVHFTVKSEANMSKSGEGKGNPVTGRGGPEGCEALRFPHFLDNRLVVGGTPYAQADLYPQEDSWYSFLLETESTPGP